MHSIVFTLHYINLITRTNSQWRDGQPLPCKNVNVNKNCLITFDTQLNTAFRKQKIGFTFGCRIDCFLLSWL